jgi:hypothetical protein
MPDIFNSEKDIEQELKLKLIMIEQSADDPVLELKLISLLYAAYDVYKVKVPKKIEGFLSSEKDRLAPLLGGIIEAKRSELNSLVEKKRKVQLEEMENAAEKEREEKEKTLSRTQLIFGDKEF